MIFKLVRVLFYLFLAAFLIGGVAIVGVQALGLFTLSNELVTGATKSIAPYAFWASTLCAVCAFILTYAPKK
ncbi:hypothetical protein PAB09_12735 [Corynebacterium sp. SCR221107]|uniref:hypothetical protein n=1 Tax=Corynebacterium sp. SCR221107 TaxID=3017361 RepID=UPI0022EC2695|nr:hypothetical protein [Corynebacterium sp. SCR221107]WBT08701.1 hypothetical protein PAB09_12735 [Corynebacterium sp. SCR221107]